MHELTQKHFETFKRQFLHWKEYLNLSDWETTFEFEDVEDCRAMVMSAAFEHRTAVVVLSKTWDIAPSPVNLKRTALHECLELLLLRFAFPAMERGTTEEQINEETHRIIRCLENRIYPKDGERKRKP